MALSAIPLPAESPGGLISSTVVVSLRTQLSNTTDEFTDAWALRLALRVHLQLTVVLSPPLR